MDRARLVAGSGPVADLRAPRLEILEVRARRDLPVGVLPGQPDLEVVGLRRVEPEVAGAQRDDTIMKAEPLEDALGVAAQRLELVVAVLGRDELHDLDLVELVLADEAARVLAGRAGLGAEARRVGGV